MPLYDLSLKLDDINNEARRRILSRYSIEDQLNVLMVVGNDLADMKRFIGGIQTKAEALKSGSAIPLDLTDDKHWI